MSASENRWILGRRRVLICLNRGREPLSSPVKPRVFFRETPHAEGDAP